MISISVTRDVDGDSGIVNLKVADILFLEWNTKYERVIVHTKEEVFFTPGTLKYWAGTLNNSGFKFRIVDRNNAVNVDRIVRLDSVFKKAYFEADVRKNSKCCTMAFKRYKDLEKEFMLNNPALLIV